MLAILVPQITSRLIYIFDWIFNDRLQVKYHVYTDEQLWLNADGVKLCYGNTKNAKASLFIKSTGLLFEQDIKPQVLSIQRWKHSTIIFYNQPGAKIPFDIFSAIFFLIVRYEEYLPYKKDKHQRFSAQSSIAHQFQFLQQPVVDIWIKELGKLLSKHSVSNIKEEQFRFIPTYDIDIAYAYATKTAFQNFLGLVKDTIRLQPALIKQRIQAFRKQIQDPYDNFRFLEDLRIRYQLQPIYFWLLPKELGAFDRNVPRNNPEQQALIQNLAQSNTIGIHPSYQSNQSVKILKEEIEFLQKTLSRPIENSRQHYIKLHLPGTYRNLIELGIQNDYSMGYADANGFRAGTSHSFYWYDLEKEEPTTLLVHPFCYMEATSLFYHKHSGDQAYAEWERIYMELKKVDGQCITIFHNYTLGNQKPFYGYKSFYERILVIIHLS